jgi:hypothetical protein
MTLYCRLRISYNDQEDLQEFYIMNFGKDCLILGYPFLRTFNPRVDWRKGKLLGGMVKIQSSMYKHLDHIVTRWQIKALKSLGKPKEGKAIYVRRMTISQEMAKQYHQKGTIQLHKVPGEYQKYKEVFSEDVTATVSPDFLITVEREDDDISKDCNGNCNDKGEHMPVRGPGCPRGRIRLLLKVKSIKERPGSRSL